MMMACLTVPFHWILAQYKQCALGLSQGWRKTILTIAGQETPLGLIMIVVGTGAGIILTSPKALMVIKGVGAVWLIYTGYLTWRAPIVTDALCTSSGATLPLTRLNRFMARFMTRASNARIIVCMISMMLQFIEPTQLLWPQLIIMVLTMLTADAVMMHVYAFSTSRIQYFSAEAKDDKNIESLLWRWLGAQQGEFAFALLKSTTSLI